MESVLIVLILLNIYIFLNFLEDRKKYWLWFGLTLGLAFLTKYTAAFLVPAYFVFLLCYHRDALKEKWLYFSTGLAILLFSPVLIYNLNLYKLVGHFDLQFAYLFKQVTPEWRASLGKVIDPFSDIVPNLFSMYSIPFIVLAILGIFYSIYRLAPTSHEDICDKSSLASPISSWEVGASSEASISLESGIFFLLILSFIT